MKYVDEYRSRAAAAHFAEEIRRIARHPWSIMEICGGQTHTIVKAAIEDLLPETITLIHGPGCPVCVTPLEMIDRAIAIAEIPGVIFTSFGDMLRVPGSSKDLLAAKAAGADVRVVYSPLDAVGIAAEHSDRSVVFFGVGFETTAPANAMAVWEAHRRNLRNFSLLSSQVLVPPAVEAILSSEASRVQGLLAAGHVCTVMGYGEYLPIAERYRVPIVVTGFEPVDILQGIAMTVAQLEAGRHEVENQYARAVRREGNPAAKRLMNNVFETTDRAWRGIGIIPMSGYRLRPAFAAHDAERIFEVGAIRASESEACRAGDVLRGLLRPPACPAFGRECSPEHPLGAPMVSAEGACAAYYHYASSRTPSTITAAASHGGAASESSRITHHER